MKYILILSLLIFSVTVQAQNNPTESTYSFIWSDNDMNLRSGPGTDFDIIEKIPFGDSIFILSQTQHKYIINGVEKYDSTQMYMTRQETKGPYLLYGNWIEVMSSSGKIGYLVDLYTLPLKPEYSKNGLHLLEINRDTLSVYDEITSFRTHINLMYKYGIKSTIEGGRFYSQSYHFPTLTIEQAFMVFQKYFNLKKHGTVTKNWKNELVIYSEICQVSFTTTKEGGVVVVYECSC